MRLNFVNMGSRGLLEKSDRRAVELHICSPFKITYMKLILAVKIKIRNKKNNGLNLHVPLLITSHTIVLQKRQMQRKTALCKQA